jgi:general secretion pathway protein F
MWYRVRLFEPSTAAVREERVQSDSPRAVERRFASSGSVVLSLRRERAMRLAGRAPLDVAWWCRELRTLLGAGMTVVEALETLHAQPLGRARAEVHRALVDALRRGQALSAAMQEVGCFPAVLIAGIKASERTSALVEALDDYLRYEEILDKLRRQAVSSAIYPAVVVSLGAVITVFLLLFVIPRFSRMYSDLHGPVSVATQILLSVSRILADHGPAIAVVLATALVGLVWAWRRGLLLRVVLHAAEQVPALRSRFDQFRLAKLYHSLALMFRGGYPLDEALQHCASLGLGGRFEQGVQAAQAALARGQRVSTAMMDAGLTDDVSARLLTVGERTGNFDRVLQTIAQRHAGDFTTFVERATRLVEPVLLTLVALVVGGIVVMMYMPVFDIASSVR